MNHIEEGLGAISSAPSGGSTKATIKVKLLDSFISKETKTKWVWLWLHQVKAYMETQRLEIDKNKSISFKPYWRSMCGSGGCLRSRIHSIYLKPSHGKSSNYGWTKGTCRTTWCFGMEWNSWNSPKGTMEACWPPMSMTSIICWLWSPWNINMLNSWSSYMDSSPRYRN
jgi:hypothetical protein